MNRVTNTLIDEYLGPKQIRSRLLGGFHVDLQSGASVKITRRRINFGKYRQPENRKGIDEDKFQEEVKHCLDLGDEVWGGIGTYGGASQEDCANVLSYAASAGINTGDQGLVLRHFGPEATIKYGWHSFTITVPKRGYVKVECGALVKVVGDLMTPALAMGHEMVPDNLVVRGKAELLLMAVQHGRASDIAVIPESDMKMFQAVTANAAVLLGLALSFQWLDFWQAIAVGYIGGCSLWSLAMRIFWRQLRDTARRKGLEIVKFDVAKVIRKSSIDEARKQGML